MSVVFVYRREKIRLARPTTSLEAATRVRQEFELEDADTIVFSLKNHERIGSTHKDWESIVIPNAEIHVSVVTSKKRLSHASASSSQTKKKQKKDKTKMKKSKKRQGGEEEDDDDAGADDNEENGEKEEECPIKNNNNMNTSVFCMTSEQSFIQNKPGSMNVYVKTLTGKLISIVCDPSDSVERFAARIYLKEGIPIRQQRLIFAGQILDVSIGKTLADFKIQHDSTVHLLQELRGGKPNIYLFPGETTSFEVGVQLQQPSWNLTHLFPVPQKVSATSCTWTGTADSDGILTTSESNQSTPYLFYEAETQGGKWSVDPSCSNVLPRETVGVWLYTELLRLGFEIQEAMECTTHWLPALQQESNVFVQFLDETAVQHWSRITITPMPQAFRRVFLLIHPVHKIEGASKDYGVHLLPSFREERRKSKQDRSFFALEWGGCVC